MQKAIVTVEHEDWDYSNLYDLSELSEEAALEIARQAAKNDVRPSEVQSVTVEVRKQVVEFKFDRQELTVQ
jgi:hypothetical protein